MEYNQPEAHQVYVARLRTVNSLIGWGMFLFWSILPLFFSLIFDVGVICLVLPLILFFVGFGILVILIQWANRARVGLWINPESLDPLGTAEQLCYFLASGYIAFSLLSSLAIYWSASIRYGAALSEIWEFIFPHVIMGLAFVPSFPIIHIVIRFLKKRRKKKRIRRKMVSGKREDLEKSAVNALKSLGLNFEEVEEGSKWVGPIPSHKIKGHNISVRVFQSGMGSASVITIARAPEDYAKAEEIERSIDSFIDSVS